MTRNLSSMILVVLLFASGLKNNTYSQSLNSKDIPVIVNGRDLSSPLNSIDREYIYVFDTKTNSLKKFTDKYKGAMAKVSPNGKYISFLGTENLGRSLFGENGLTAEVKLILFKPNGQYHKSFDIPDMGRYEWSPDETNIVFVEKGQYIEMAESWANFLWVLDINTGERFKILKKCTDYFNWALFDGNIYFTSAHYVYRYTIDKKEIEKSHYQGVDFSADGKYYLSFGFGEWLVKMFIRSNNADITNRFESTIKQYFVSTGQDRTYNQSSVKWIERDKLVFLDDIVSRSYIYDVDTDSIVDSFDGHYIGTISQNKNQMLIENHHHIFVRDRDSAPKRID